jgi:hypothetical protein
MSKYCPRCGAVLADNAEFCNKCGTRVTSEATPANGITSNQAATSISAPGRAKPLAKGETMTVQGDGYTVTVDHDNVTIEVQATGIYGLFHKDSAREIIPLRSISLAGYGATDKGFVKPLLIGILGIILMMLAFASGGSGSEIFGLVGIVMIVYAIYAILTRLRARVYIENGCSVHYLPGELANPKEARSLIDTIIATSNEVRNH